MKCRHCQLNVALLSDLNAQHKALRERLRKAQDELFGELIVNEFMRRELRKRDLPDLAHSARKKAGLSHPAMRDHESQRFGR